MLAEELAEQSGPGTDAVADRRPVLSASHRSSCEPSPLGTRFELDAAYTA